MIINLWVLMDEKTNFGVGFSKSKALESYREHHILRNECLNKIFTCVKVDIVAPVKSTESSDDDS